MDLEAKMLDSETTTFVSCHDSFFPDLHTPQINHLALRTKYYSSEVPDR